MTVSDYLVSLVRTVVPTVIGYVIAVLAGWGIDVDPTTLEVTLTSLLVGGYYAIARGLEAVHPWFGVLLGWKATPTYVKGVGDGAAH